MFIDGDNSDSEASLPSPKRQKKNKNAKTANKVSAKATRGADGAAIVEVPRSAVTLANCSCI